MLTSKVKIVLVEDDEVTLTVLNSIVHDLKAEVIKFNTGSEALEFIEKNDDVKILITDITMPKMTGDVLVREVLQQKPWIDAFIITGTKKINNAIPTYMSGAREIFIKPLKKNSLRPFIEESIARHSRWVQFLKDILQADESA